MKSGGKTNRSRGAPEKGGSKPAWTIGLIVAAACQLLIFWFAEYPAGNLEDKAARYYSAARLFAEPARLQAVATAEPFWYNRLPPGKLQAVKERLHATAASPAANLLARGFCAAAAGGGPPAAYAYPVKLSLLALFLLALGWLIAVTFRHDVDAVLVPACLVMAAVNLHIPWIAPASGPASDFLSSLPRTSAALLVLAGFACFARGRGILAAISLLLAGVWQADMAAGVLPCAALAIGLTLCDRAGSHYVRFMAAVLIVLGAVLLERYLPGAYTLELWIPAFLIVLFLLIGPLTLDPAWRATASLAAFLFLSLALQELLAHGPFHAWISRVSGLPGITDLGLPQVRHLASLALALAVLIGLANRILPYAFQEPHRRTALLALASLGLVAAFASSMPRWTRAARQMAVFAHDEGSGHPRPVVDDKDLRSLDPRREEAFFAALGDFLLRPDARP